MSKRPAVISIALSAILMLIAVLPVASASAAEPWWQVLTGSRPSNMWEPVDAVETQEVTGASLFGAIFAVKVTVAGEVVGCLGSGSVEFVGGPSADTACEEATGFPASESATEFEEMLEGPYGTGAVAVSGGPAGAAPFEVESSWGPPISLSPIEVNTEFGPFLAEEEGSAGSKVTSEGSGRLLLTITNLGDESVDGSGTAVRIVDKLPPGAVAYGVEVGNPRFGKEGTIDCAVEAADEVVCSYTGTVRPYEALEVEVLTALAGSPPVADTAGEIVVSGGNAKSVGVAQRINISAEPVQFGIEQFTAVAEEEGGEPVVPGLGGTPATLAGSHPFQFTTTFQLNAGRMYPTPPRLGKDAHWATVEQPALPRNLRFQLPAGLVGNASTMPQCEMRTFLHSEEFINSCSDATVIGVSSVTVVESFSFGLLRLAVPVFNLPPADGEPARFGVMVVGAPVIIDTSVNPNDRYRITAQVSNVSQIAKLLSATTTLWGTPGDPRHDNARGWNCVYLAPAGPCERPANLGEEAFLRLPVQCSSPLNFGVEVEPWNVPLGSVVASKSYTSEALQGCNQLPFSPDVSAAPTTKQAGSQGGLGFQLDMPSAGLPNQDEIAEGQAKKVEVTLPEGMTINPSQAEGLGACSPAQYAQERFDSAPGAGCPESSKIGSVDITTPLLDEEAHGSVYVAAPYDNPFDSLLALYMVAKIPDRGILVKQAGKVELNPVTGQITTTFDDLPQVPFESFKLHFFEGNRAPLVMPSKCGSYDIVTRFTPWHAADPDNPLASEVITKTTPFTIDQGCPSGTPPFKPGFIAGTESNAAGKYSPFTARLTRNDGEQEFSRFSMKLPKGVIGKLAGIPFCSEAEIAAARARTGPHGGQEELDSPSCPSASQIGRTSVGAGVGPSLSYAPGKIYLAGPYQGSKLSIVAMTTATVGPFDLGTVVIRQALRVDPETAEVTADGSSSDPIPHILQGIVTHARDIRVFADRPNFVLNPTSCERMTADASVFGTGLDFGSLADDQAVDVSSPFQAADCASLGFKPKLKLTLSGGTKRSDTPKLKAVLTARKGDANIGRAQVTLPHSAFLEQGHIRTICTRVQFRAGAGNGAQCPKASVYGRAKAFSPLLDEPLVGPVFLRSSNHELPDLVAALHSKKVDIDLVGRIDSLDGRIRNTFDAVPDAPVTKFILEMQGGQKGLIVNSTDICRGKHRAIADFTGQNGRRHLFKPVVHAKCPGKRR